MKGHFLTKKEIERFRNYLREEEKSENTLETLAKICIALQCEISDIVEIKWEKQ